MTKVDTEPRDDPRVTALFDAHPEFMDRIEQAMETGDDPEFMGVLVASAAYGIYHDPEPLVALLERWARGEPAAPDPGEDQ